MKKYSIAITLLTLAAVVVVFVGKTYLNLYGILLTNDFITALFPNGETSWRWTFVVFLWLSLGCGVLASVFAWIKAKWASVLTLILCLCPIVWHVISSIINHYSVFDLSGIWEVLLLLLPLIAAVFSILLIKARGEEA